MNAAEYSTTFLITNFSFWMILIIQLLYPFSIISLTLFYCCTKKVGKNLKGENTSAGIGSGSGGTNGVGKNSDKAGDEMVIKTDKTQEETEITQEISNVGEGENMVPSNYELSPYPFEMFHRGFGGKKKKKHHKQQQQQQPEHKTSGTKRTRQQRSSRPSQQQQQQQIQKLPNEIDAISQPQATHPRQVPVSEVVSKPMSQKEKIPFKEKSQAKPSLDLPLGSDATQSAVCSTQPSHLQIDNNATTTNNNIQSSNVENKFNQNE